MSLTFYTIKASKKFQQLLPLFLWTSINRWFLKDARRIYTIFEVISCLICLKNDTFFGDLNIFSWESPPKKKHFFVPQKQVFFQEIVFKENFQIFCSKKLLPGGGGGVQKNYLWFLRFSGTNSKPFFHIFLNIKIISCVKFSFV